MTQTRATTLLVELTHGSNHETRFFGRSKIDSVEKTSFECLDVFKVVK